MIRTPLRRGVALAGALLLSVTGLVTATTVAADAAGHGTTYVHIDQAHHVHIARHIRPGVDYFRVTSVNQEDSFELVHPHRGYTVAEALVDANKGLSGGDLAHLKRFEANTDLLGGAAASPGHPSTLVARVPHGRVWALDNGTEPTTRTNVTVLHTQGAYVQRRIPGTRTMTAFGETHWAARPSSIPTHGMLRFDNRSQDNHFVELDELAPGKTYQDFVNWINAAKNGSQDPPPLKQTGGYYSGVVGPHRVASTSYSLSKGDYVVLCWWPDADMGGMPHAFMGMYRELHVG